MSINLHILIIFYSLQQVSGFCKTPISQFYPVKLEQGERERGREEIPGTRRPWVTPIDQELSIPKMAKLYREEKLGEELSPVPEQECLRYQQDMTARMILLQVLGDPGRIRKPCLLWYVCSLASGEKESYAIQQNSCGRVIGEGGERGHRLTSSWGQQEREREWQSDLLFIRGIAYAHRESST